MFTRAHWRGLLDRGRNVSFRDEEFSAAKGASIWELFPLLALLDPKAGFVFFDDFLQMAMDDTTHNPLAWTYQSDTAAGAVTLPNAATVGPGGVARLATGGVDENETYIQAGHLNTFEPFVITDASKKIVAFECRVRVNQHAADSIACFIGLAEAGCAAADFLTNATGVIADKDFIGFNVLSATPTAWNATWKKAGQVVQAIVGGAVNADDWHIFSFIFTGLSTVQFCFDGVLHATVATTTAATFPSGEEMSPIIAIKETVAGAKTIDVDWIKVAQSALAGAR